MSDLISRQKVIEALEKYSEHAAIYIVKELPTAQPEPSQVARDIATIIENEMDMRVILSAQPERKKGRWISADAIYHGVPFYCSECGENTRDTVMMKPRWNFCPNCGAEMRDGE